MNFEVLSALQGLRLTEPVSLKQELIKLLIGQMEDAPVTIKIAKNQFTRINRKATEGQIQVIRGAKGVPGKETVIVSIQDLAAIIYASVAGVTWGDALAATGFTPVKGRPIVLEDRLRTETELRMPKRQRKKAQAELAEAF